MVELMNSGAMMDIKDKVMNTVLLMIRFHLCYVLFLC